MRSEGEAAAGRQKKRKVRFTKPKTALMKADNQKCQQWPRLIFQL